MCVDTIRTLNGTVENRRKDNYLFLDIKTSFYFLNYPETLNGVGYRDVLKNVESINYALLLILSITHWANEKKRKENKMNLGSKYMYMYTASKTMVHTMKHDTNVS